MYRGIDLHIHTPFSDCYQDHMMPEAELHTSPQDIIAAALEVGLEAIAITDHNTVQGIESIRRAAQGTGLHVFPGIEISAWGGHVLALFSEDVTLREMGAVLASLGFGEEKWGHGFEETEFWIDQVFQVVAERGGLAIAAHADRKPRGFIASADISIEDKKRIYTSPYLEAMEITIPQDRVLWTGGMAPGYPRKCACIQGSDAHAPGEIGRRPIYVDLPELSLEGLRLAFREHNSHIRFPDEMEEAS
ncbi:MAG: PHP domain-containing protein [Dehalococcoidia bacterium]